MLAPLIIMFSLTVHAGSQPPEIDSEITLEQFCEEQALSGGAEYPPPLYKDQPTAGLCGYNPLVGDKGRLIVENIRHEPDPFNPDEEEAMLEMDIIAVELPGLPSGQFEFRAEVTWRIECHRTHRVIREIVEDVDLPYTGVHYAALFWDGHDADTNEVPAGVYPHKLEIRLIRTKTRGGGAGKEKIFDEVESPWLFITIQRDDYYVDEDAAALLEHSIKDPLGAPNIPIKIVRSPVGTINMVYGEDFRVPMAAVGCDLGDDELNGLCFLSYFGPTLGISDPAGDLEFSKVHPISAEHDLAVFKQLFHGREVTGRHVTLMVNKSMEVTQIHSAAALPISGPEPQEIQAAFDAFDPVAGIDALREARSIPELEAISLKEVIFTGLSEDAYIAIPAVEMTAHAPHPLDRYVLGVLDAATSSILTYEDLTAESARDRYLNTVALFPGVTGDSAHPDCLTTVDCRSKLGDDYAEEICSDHFTPNRCVLHCRSDDDCDGGDWKCFLPSEATDLLGYCYYRTENQHDPEEEITVFADTADLVEQWLNPYLYDHDAFRNLTWATEDIQWHHRDIGLYQSFDGKDTSYNVRLFAVCKCDENTGRCIEYDNCPRGQVNYPTADNIKLTANWRSDWATFEDLSLPYDHVDRLGQRGIISSREYVLGHEYGHLIQGAVHGRWGMGCLKEGTATMFGALFAASQHNLPEEEYSIRICVNPYLVGDPFFSDSGGLDVSCESRRGPLPYAYRSRFDWLDCIEEQWGEACKKNDDCPEGEECKHPDNYDRKLCTKTWTDIDCTHDHDCPPYHKCTEMKDADENVIGRFCMHRYNLYNSGPIMRRLMRIMSLGPEPFYEEGHFEDIDIIKRPLGINTTGKILAQTSPQLNHTTTMREWMELMKKSASDHDTGDRQTFSATVDALGASGFFPRETVVTGYKSPTAPAKTVFTSPRDGVQRELTAWSTDTGFIRYQIRMPDGGTCTSTVPLSDADTRPAVVEYGNHVHIFWWDHTYQTIMVLLVPRAFRICGEHYGPYPLGGMVAAPLGTPNGAMSALSYQGRLYLVFGDKWANNSLALAYCDHPFSCDLLDRWHDFGGGKRSKVVWGMPIQEGPSAIAASNVNGLPLDEEFLFVAFAEWKPPMFGGRIGVLRLNNDHEVLNLYNLSEYSPSYTTAKPIGLTVRSSAFPQKCDPGDVVPACPRNYLYLVWKHTRVLFLKHFPLPIYTSVLQNADPHDYWFTRPVESLYSTTTGVSWTLGREPERNVEAVYIQPWTSRIVQFHGYGRY